MRFCPGNSISEQSEPSENLPFGLLRTRVQGPVYQEVCCIFGLPHLLPTGTMQCLSVPGLCPLSNPPHLHPVLFSLSHRCSSAIPLKRLRTRPCFVSASGGKSRRESKERGGGGGGGGDAMGTDWPALIELQRFRGESLGEIGGRN